MCGTEVPIQILGEILEDPDSAQHDHDTVCMGNGDADPDTAHGKDPMGANNFQPPQHNDEDQTGGAIFQMTFSGLLRR